MTSKISIILIILFSIPLFPQNDIKVLSSDKNKIVVRFTPRYSDTSEIKIDNQSFRKIEFSGGFVANPEIWGIPALQQKIINIGVPAEFGNTIQILDAEYKEIPGRVSPKPVLVKDSVSNHLEYKIGENYNDAPQNSELVSFDEFGSFRGLKVQSLKLRPVQFDKASNKIKLYTSILFQVNFSSNQKINNAPSDNFLQNAVINYNTAKYWKPVKKTLQKAVYNSVLAEGKWVKFEAPEEGMYKITRDMLPSFGIDPNAVDPRTIKIYNNGGKVLSENINAPRPDDLVENAILVVGEDDGKFDASDYILFYGRGTDFWDYDSAAQTIKRYFHPYSTKNYYWITSGGTTGKRITSEAGVNDPNAVVQNSTKAFADFEEEKVNIGKTGTEYFGDNFSGTMTITYL